MNSYNIFFKKSDRKEQVPTQCFYIIFLLNYLNTKKILNYSTNGAVTVPWFLNLSLFPNLFDEIGRIDVCMRTNLIPAFKYFQKNTRYYCEQGISQSVGIFLRSKQIPSALILSFYITYFRTDFLNKKKK